MLGSENRCMELFPVCAMQMVVSLFVDPDLTQLRAAKQVGADAVEIHTGTY